MEPILAIATMIVVPIFDCSNVFHDAASIVATIIASRTKTPAQAVLVVGTFEFPGPRLGSTVIATTIGKIITATTPSIFRRLAEPCVLIGQTSNRRVEYMKTSNADADCKAERQVKKTDRPAITEVFQGVVYINMRKRREIYRPLSNAASRMTHCANTLHDVVVKCAEGIYFAAYSLPRP